jgi:hypothetical protein
LHHPADLLRIEQGTGEPAHEQVLPLRHPNHQPETGPGCGSGSTIYRRWQPDSLPSTAVAREAA